MTKHTSTPGRIAAWLAAAILFTLCLGWAGVTLSRPRQRTPDGTAPTGGFVEPDGAILNDAGINRIARPASSPDVP